MLISNVVLQRVANADKGVAGVDSNTSYSHQYNLEVHARAHKNANLKAHVYFCNGSFHRCNYEAPGTYDFDTWMFMGEVAQLIQAMDAEYSYTHEKTLKKPKKGEGRQAPYPIQEIIKACPDAFEL